MPLGAEDVQPAECADLLALLAALLGEDAGQLCVPRTRPLAVGAELLGELVHRHAQVVVLHEELGRETLVDDLLARQALGVAAEEDVDAAARHVGGDRDGTELARLRDDVGLPRVLLGVQHLVPDPALRQFAAEQLALLHADRSDEDGLTLRVPLHDVLDDGTELGVLRLEDEVCLVRPAHGPVRGDRHDLQPIGVDELGRLGLGGARHAGELAVHAEVVLQRDGGEGLVLLVDPHALLGLHGLVDALAPAAALEDAPRELVDDLHLTGLDDVVLVPAVELLSLQRDLELVDQVLLDGVVQVVDVEGLLDLLDARLGGHHDALVLLDLVVDVALERAHDGGEAVVRLGGIGETARDDERRACLVDEDRVDLVHDREVVPALHLVLEGAGHVVAQVVEPELVVGAVRDGGRVLAPLLRRRVPLAGQHDPDVETEEPVDPAHPLGMEPGEIVVHGDDVHALPGEPVQVGGKGRHEGLALARLHLGDPPEVERRAAHDLHVEVALADDPARGLPHRRERLHEEVVEVGAVRQAAAELGGLGLERLVGEGTELGLECVDVRDEALEGLHPLAVTGTEDFVED